MVFPLRPALCGMLLALLLAALPATAGETAAEREAEKAQVRARIKAVQAQVERDRGRQDALENQLQDTEADIAAAQQQLRGLREQLSAQQRKVDDTRTLQTRASSDLDRQRRALAQQLRAAFAIGRSGPLKLLLNQEDVQRAGRVMAYYDNLNKSRGDRIRGIGMQMQMMRDIGEKLQTEIGTLEGLKSRQETLLAELDATRAERRSTIEKLAERIADSLAELKRLEGEEQRLQGLIEQLGDALADVPLEPGSNRPLAQQKGKLPWPLRGKLLGKFGQSKAGGQFTWRGHWIEAPEGANVKAVAAGRAAYVGWMQRYGLIVIVEHPGGYYSLYGHLQRAVASEGEAVKAGEVLATAGNTGGYDKSGVYFELRKGREPVNPADWLSR